jgi:molecular chaperone GrpE
VDEARVTGPGQAEAEFAAPGEIVPETSEQDVSADQRVVSGEILAGLRELRECFDSKLRYDQAKERQIDALHEELSGYRQGLYQQIMMPVMNDLIGIYDEVAGQLARLPDADPGGLDFVFEMVETVLERYEVTRFSCEGEIIDRSRQKVIDTESTTDPELGKKLARRVRHGFEMKGKVIRPEWVVAYRYVPGQAAGE